MLSIAPMDESSITEIAAAFSILNKSEAQYLRYFAEHQSGTRLVLVARSEGAVSGYVTVNWQSDYPPFRESGIPEIQDFNVLPDQRRRGIGWRLMDEAETHIRERSPMAGLGVGLHHDYGAAQRLYVVRGYIPDARGITSHGRRVNWGDPVKIDDDLVLWLTKSLC